jgi:thiosulfate sulfurtransferase|tara:strand:- start:126 stop:419 length:294 start_codon:yes stop_codon:yes gene_type:complete
MNKFKHISVEEAKELLRADNYLIDIRDEESFSISHVEGALNLSDENIAEFVKTSHKNRPTIIYCYKGISSQNAAHYLSSQGFKDLYSVDGGFEEWKK